MDEVSILLQEFPLTPAKDGTLHKERGEDAHVHEARIWFAPGPCMTMDEMRDFVVIGSGGGSMCAGLVMRQAGRSVLILEKTDLIGGSTARAGGVMWIPANRFMRDAGIEDSIDQAVRYLDATVGVHEDQPGATPERRLAYIRQSGSMLEFLIGQGIRFRRNRHWPDYYDDRPGGIASGRTVVAELFDAAELGEWRKLLRPNNIQIPAPFDDLFKITLFKRSWKGRLAMARTAMRIAMARITGRRWVIGGAALQGRMLQAALREGVEFRLNAPVAEIIIEDGIATGVAVIENGVERRIGARLGILINAGGFAWNQQMRDRYIPKTRTGWTHAAPGDTGDMHLELMRLGAAMAQMDEMVGNQMTVPPGVGPVAAQQQVAKPHAFLVDQSGVRYQNECGSYMEFCQNMLARDRDVPAIPSWMIFDSRYMRDYMLGPTMPGSKKPQAWFDMGFLQQGETIGALATACGIAPDVLEQTVSRFNGFVRAGRDTDFHRGERAYDRFLGDFTQKPVETLGEVSTAPFYAIPIVPGDVGTFGGVVTDRDARVIKEDGSIIPGLYATGTTTASVMGRCYPGAGCSIGPAFTWGYVAAQHALGRAGT